MEEIRSDKEVQIIEQEAPNLVSKVGALQIADERTGKFANDLMVGIKKAITTLEERRKHFVGPLNDHIRTINAEFKEITVPLKTALEVVRGKMLGYQVVLRKKEEAEAKKKEALLKEEARKKQEALKGLVGEEGAKEIAKPEEIKVEEKKPTVTSSMGKSFLKKVWAFREVDFAKVPDEYKVLDEKKINYTIKANTRTVKGESVCKLEIPGIEIYQKDQLGVR